MATFEDLLNQGQDLQPQGVTPPESISDEDGSGFGSLLSSGKKIDLQEEQPATDDEPLYFTGNSLSADPEQNNEKNTQALINAEIYGVSPSRAMLLENTIGKRKKTDPQSRNTDLLLRKAINDKIVSGPIDPKSSISTIRTERERLQKLQRDYPGSTKAMLNGSVGADTYNEQELTGLEKTFKEYAVDPAMVVARFAPRAVVQLAKFANEGTAFAAGVLDSAAVAVETVTGLQSGGGFTWLRDWAQMNARQQGKQIQEGAFIGTPEDIRGKRLWDNPELILDPEWVLTNLGDTAASLLPTIAATYATGGSYLAGGLIGGVMEGGGLYSELLDPEFGQPVSDTTALNSALIFGTASGWLNKIGLEAILGKKAVQKITRRITRSLVAGGTEAITEWAEEPTGALVEALAREGVPTDTKEIQDVLSKVAEGATNIDVMVGSFLLGGGGSYISQSVDIEQNKAQTAKRDSQMFDLINEMAGDSTLKSSSPVDYQKAFETIKNEAGIKVESVFVPVDSLIEAVPDESQRDKLLADMQVKGLFDEALESPERTVAIPISTYAAHIAGTDLSTQLKSDIKFRVNGVSEKEGGKIDSIAKNVLEKTDPILRDDVKDQGAIIIGVEENEDGEITGYTMASLESGDVFETGPDPTAEEILSKTGQVPQIDIDVDKVIETGDVESSLRVTEAEDIKFAQKEKTFHTQEQRDIIKQERKRTFEPVKISKEVLPEDVSKELPPLAGGRYFHSTSENLQSWLDKNGDGFLYRVTITEALVDGFDVGLKDYKHRFTTDQFDAGTAKSHTFTSSLDDVKAIAKSRPDAIVYRVMPQDIDDEFAAHVYDGPKGVIHVHSPKPAHIDETVVIYQDGQWFDADKSQESRRFIEERRTARKPGAGLELRPRVRPTERAEVEPVTPQPLSKKDQLRSAVDKLITPKGRNNMGIEVVQSISDLEEDLDYSISIDNTVEGAFDPFTGKIYLVADNIAPDQAWTKLLHEGTHKVRAEKGWSGVFGKQAEKIMSDIDAKIEAGDLAWKIAEDKAVKAKTPDSKLREETITYFLADNTNKTKGLWKRIVKAIREWAIRNGFKKKNITDQDIVNLAEASVRRAALKRGGSAADEGVLFSKKSEQATLSGISNAWEDRGIQNSIHESKGIITVSEIVVPKEKRGEGAGTEAMNELIEYADRTNQIIALTPSKDFGATSVNRLKKFYKGLGFVENKGKNRDFSHLEDMYRIPAEGVMFSKKDFKPVDTNSPEFKEWFGNSEVVGKDGKPLVVYHGTAADAADVDFQFDYTKIGEQGRAEGAGFYFTTSLKVAKAYSRNDNMIEAYMSIQKPMPYSHPAFDFDTIRSILKRTAELEAEDSGENIADGLLSNYNDVRSLGLEGVLDEAAELLASEEDALDQLGGLVGGGADIEQINIATRSVTGFDGVEADGFSDLGGTGPGGSTQQTIYVAFFPEQIKSAKSNTGEFSAEDPRIMFSKRISEPTKLENTMLEEVEEQGQKISTGKSVIFTYLHNKESATKLFGIPKKKSQHSRYYEPSGQYVVAVTNIKIAEQMPDQYEAGEITFENPLVIDSGGLDADSWKQRLSRDYGGKRGKELSKALIADGYDGVITISNGHTSEILNLQTFKEDRALFSKKMPEETKQKLRFRAETVKEIKTLAEQARAAKDAGDGKLARSLRLKLVELIGRAKSESATAHISTLSEKQKVQRRRQSINDIRDYFGLTDNDLKKISRKDVRLMSNYEFKKYKDEIQIKALEFADTRQAKLELLNTIHELNLQKVDNFRDALDLPPIRDMNTNQLRDFEELLGEFHEGDSFLNKRQLETVDRSFLKGIRTWREAKERLAAESGVSIEELDKVKVSGADNFKWDNSLYESNPFYRVLVTRVTSSLLDAQLKAHEIESKVYDLADKAQKSVKRSLMDRVIPNDKQIFDYLEANKEGKEGLAAQMTSEQLEFAHYMQEYFSQALTYLMETKSLSRGRENYFVHMRRTLLESIRDDGLITGVREMFKNYEQDQMGFNILDDNTGNILPLEKFFQFSLQRSGELAPTKNIVRAFLTYANTFEKKVALDGIMPAMSIYAQSLTPTIYTQKGLEIDQSIKKFVNKWINNKKGRRISYDSVVRQGGKLDLLMNSTRMFVSMLKLGFSPIAQTAAPIGEQSANFIMMGVANQAKGTARMTTKKGKRIVAKYEGVVGRTLFETLTAPGEEATSRFTSLMFAGFHAGSRIANAQYLLGMMTDAEYKAEEISTERLTKMELEKGRFRAVPGSASLVGSTSPGKLGTQFKSWAIPVIRTTLKDLAKVSKDIKNKPFGEKLTSRESAELLRITFATGMILAVAGIYQADADDDSLLSKLITRALSEASLIYSAFDVRWMLFTTPPAIKWTQDLGMIMADMLQLVEYKDGSGLKGPRRIVQHFTPGFIKSLRKKKKKNKY